MPATLAKYGISEYPENSEKFLTKKESSSIQYLGNAWQLSEETVQSPLAYYHRFPITHFSEKNIFKKRALIRKNLKTYIPFKAEIIPIDLKPIYEEIELSKELLNIEEGWDGYDAPSIPKIVYYKSISFLKDYSNFIYRNTGIAINAPEINLGRNENIYLSWRTNNARLAISIEKKNGELIANYYGDLNNKQPIKGYVSTDEISEYLAYWMKNLI